MISQDRCDFSGSVGMDVGGTDVCRSGCCFGRFVGQVDSLGCFTGKYSVVLLSRVKHSVG